MGRRLLQRGESDQWDPTQEPREATGLQHRRPREPPGLRVRSKSEPGSGPFRYADDLTALFLPQICSFQIEHILTRCFISKRCDPCLKLARTASHNHGNGWGSCISSLRMRVENHPPRYKSEQRPPRWELDRKNCWLWTRSMCGPW